MSNVTEQKSLSFSSVKSVTISPARAFKEKSILVTGTSGFLGKVVVEKILRDLPDIKTIYLLIRGNRKHTDSQQRFQHEIATSSVFNKLKDKYDNFDELCERKIRCVTGEVTEIRFGLSSEAYEKLASQVDLVINSAASVNFREEIDQALKINTLCLHNIVHFSKTAGDVPVLQVSTCYVNGFHTGDIYEENVAPKGRSLPWNKGGYFEVEALIQELQEKVSVIYQRFTGKKRKEKLVDLGIRQAQRYGWNDTYTLTKWMGEQLLRKSLQGRPLTILRPAIIESALSGPEPGWIEGVKVADAIVMAYARGKVNLFPGRSTGVADVIPVDLVANSIIVSASELLEGVIPRHRVYQCCSGSSNPLVVKHMVKYVVDEAQQNYHKYPRLFLKKPRHHFILVNRKLFLAGLNSVRAALWTIEKGVNLLGKKGGLMAFERIQVSTRLSTIFSFYTSPNYIFHNEKLISLFSRMNEEEKNCFSVDAKRINWKSYWRDYHLAGLNRYSLDDRNVVKLKAETETKKSKAA